MADWDDDAIDWYAKNYGEDVSNRWVMEAAGVEPPEDVLDIGCGTGAALRIAEAGGSRRLVGVDPFARMIGHAKAATAAESRIEYFVAPGEALPFDDASFDVVTMINVVHHFDDVKKGLSEAARVLRPTGRLVIGGERFGKAMVPEGQNYDASLAALGLTEIRTTDVADGDGFVTVAMRGDQSV